MFPLNGSEISWPQLRVSCGSEQSRLLAHMPLQDSVKRGHEPGARTAFLDWATATDERRVSTMAMRVPATAYRVVMASSPRAYFRIHVLSVLQTPDHTGQSSFSERSCNLRYRIVSVGIQANQIYGL